MPFKKIRKDSTFKESSLNPGNRKGRYRSEFAGRKKGPTLSQAPWAVLDWKPGLPAKRRGKSLIGRPHQFGFGETTTALVR